MRVYELAREIGVTSDQLLQKCRTLGMDKASQLSGLTATEALTLRNAAGSKVAVVAEAPVQKKQHTASARKAKPSASKTPVPPLGRPASVVKTVPPQVPPQLKAAHKPPSPKVIPLKPIDAKGGEAEESEHEIAARKRRKDRTTRQNPVEDALAVEAPLVLGRYIPPSTIPRYPRRSMRHGGGRKPKRIAGATLVARATSVTVQAPISIRDLSAAVGVKANMILLKLMQLGRNVTINAMLTVDDVRFLAQELTLNMNVAETPSVETIFDAVERKPDRSEDLKPRAPVVTFLGHVDHGKTSLLDRIRKTDVAAHEFGGITQHIGAYRVTMGGHTVVFLDTPGHEAFTAMRSRGANVTDIAVLVVAADDGVMPQTEEAIDHARAAEVPIVVAINKCDKPEANVMRVKQQLTSLGLQPEDWGGDAVCVEVSALTGKGVDDLIEMLSLVAELRELKANPDKPAQGTALEAQMSESRGPIATVLVQEGTLRVGDTVVCGATYGRVKALLDDRYRAMKEAGPSTPVTLVGLGVPPDAGDRFLVLPDAQKARVIAEERQRKAREAAVTKRHHVNLENLFTSIEEGRVKELRLILKGDVRGTLEALNQVIGSISTQEVKTHILRSSVGGISVSDVLLADASDAVLLGMNVVVDSAARLLAEEKGVAIRIYNVIYRIKEEIERALVGMLAPEEREVVTGHAEVRQVFRISRVGNVAGCYVSDGMIARSNFVRLSRDGKVIYSGRLGSLKRLKDDARDVRDGFECGMRLDGYDDIKVGDVIEGYQIEKITRTFEADRSSSKPSL